MIDNKLMHLERYSDFCVCNCNSSSLTYNMLLYGLEFFFVYLLISSFALNFIFAHTQLWLLSCTTIFTDAHDSGHMNAS